MYKDLPRKNKRQPSRTPGVYKGSGNAARGRYPCCVEAGPAVKNLVDLVKQGVQFKSLTDVIDTATPSGRFFFHVMASLAR